MFIALLVLHKLDSSDQTMNFSTNYINSYGTNMLFHSYSNILYFSDTFTFLIQYKTNPKLSSYMVEVQIIQ